MTVREMGLRRVAAVTTGLAAVSVAGVLGVATLARASTQAATPTQSSTTGSTSTSNSGGTSGGPTVTNDNTGSAHATSGGS
jgi:hypothetical protein